MDRRGPGRPDEDVDETAPVVDMRVRAEGASRRDRWSGFVLDAPTMKPENT